MIWHDGEIVAEREVRIDLTDRVFEHGLGLFETLRTWGGRAPLLERHLDRLRKSAHELGLATIGVALPDQVAVTALLDAAGVGIDAMLRITMTGGSATSPPVVWMTASRLPILTTEPVKVVVYDRAIASDDQMGAHKSLNYWSRRLAHAWAEARGAADCLLTDGQGRLWEASRTSVLFVPEGRETTLATPALEGPIVPGIMRRVALDFAASLGYRIEERPVRVEELTRARAVYLTNSVRGVRRVGQIDETLLCDNALRLSLQFSQNLLEYLNP